MNNQLDRQKEALFIYVDDVPAVYQSQSIEEIETNLTESLSNLYDIIEQINSDRILLNHRQTSS